jgi:hypothetical protein
MQDPFCGWIMPAAYLAGGLCSPRCWSLLPNQELERSVYDLVLMDLHMPVIDGLEASRRIRDLYPPAQRPKIVALSADTTQVRARTRDHCSKHACSLTRQCRVPMFLLTLRLGPVPEALRPMHASSGACGSFGP